MKDSIAVGTATAIAPETGYVSIPMAYAMKADTDALAERLAALEKKIDFITPCIGRPPAPYAKSQGALKRAMTGLFPTAVEGSGPRAFLDTGSWSSVYGVYG